jgi:hypothetical protein
MWSCPNCHETIDNQFDSCWKCGRKANDPSPPNQTIVMTPPRQVKFQIFRGVLVSWDDLFAEAADFASALTPGQLINISHSEDRNDGVVTVWYWEDKAAET